ncbi:hypothetical protein I7860_30405 [Pseudomonas tolaasii]|uniref:ParB/Srx family N-terminal domain-containing protein n=1 Tax=Pseudomonas tolaasii TaxID=29442 RepID=UPI001C57AF8C|nr:ParB/Srx family N-terminal domain-containing protein [Pseudomonas tolaasii]MBW1250980.1 hypothetical protein [Pseudomonas tolaasii]
MKRNIASIALDLVKLDQANVRFGNDVAQSQREAIELLMADFDDARKILKLAEHIAQNGLDPTEIQLVTPGDEGTYIVLEGNRRLTALKLLQKPDLCPVEKLVKGFMAAHARMDMSELNEVDVSIVPTREGGEMWLELKHTGENGGIGRVNWSSDIRDERRGRRTGVESIGRQIRNLIKDNPDFFSEETLVGINLIPVTTLTRLFTSAPAQEAFQIKVEGRELDPQLSLKYIAPSVEFAIDLFVTEGFNVNQLRSDDDRKAFVGYIPPELHPLKVKTAEESPAASADVPPVQPSPDTSGTSGADGAGGGVGTTNAGVPQPVTPPLTQSGQGVAASGPASATPTAVSPKIRAKPISRARKYLVPWSLNIGNNRVNAIYRDLRSTLVVDVCPNATAVTFRVFVEISCDDYILSQGRAGTPVLRHDTQRPVKTGAEEKLAMKVQAVVLHLEASGQITKAVSKAIVKRASSFDSVGSVDHFNLFVHSSASAPIPSELKDIADEYRPFLEAIWG